MVDNIQFEAVKTALRQSKDGYSLTLVIHPDDIPDDLVKDFVGARYVVVMVRLDDEEKPMVREKQLRPACRQNGCGALSGHAVLGMGKQRMGSFCHVRRGL